MASTVEVSPQQLRGAARQLGDLRDRLRGILADLENSLATKGAAWGGDGYGSTFADGPQGYTAAHKNLVTGIGNTAETIASYSTGQYKAADLLTRMEQRSAASF